MNIQEIRNNNKREYLDPMHKCEVNVIKINLHNSIEHEKRKANRAIEYMFLGKHVITECYFKNGKRGDIFVLDEGFCAEILESETEEQFQEKIKTYPCEVIGFKRTK